MANELIKNLDERASTFVAHFVEHGCATAAMRAMGLSESSARTSGWRILQRPEVVAAVHAEIGRRLVSDAAMARRVIKQIAESEDTPQKVRLDAAKILIDRGGHVAPRAKSDESGAGRELHEMSLDELKDQRDTLQTEIVSRAKTVSAPNAPTLHGDSVDLLS